MTLDLTGRWIGRYTYMSGEAVPFEADLLHSGYLIEGQMREPNTFHPDTRDELTAQLLGWAGDAGVFFKKRYDGLSDGQHPSYEGRVLRNGLRLEGSWSFESVPGWRGGFSMIRKPPIKAEHRSEARVEA